MKKWDPKSLKSREAQFLYELVVAEGLDKIKHPVFGTLMSQVIKMLSLLDENKGYQLRVKSILDNIKEDW